MKNISQWVKFVLILALTGLSVPAVEAATADDFWNKAGLSDFKDELALFGAKLDRVDAGDNIWSADGGLFGLPSVKFFVYWVSASPVPLPVVAIPLPVDLTVSTLTNYLFDGDGYLNLGLNHPVVFWSPKGDVQLRSTEMPPLVREQAKSAGLPDTMRLAKGFNLFGRVSGAFLDELTKLGLPNPNNLTVGLAKRKAKEKDKATQQNREFKIVSASVALSADTSWSGPFGLANTSIRGATLRFTTKTDQATKIKQKTKETWGTLKIKDKDYVAYLERDDLGLAETLAFDTKVASLKNFFDIAEVLTDTLGLPKIPFPSGLPLDKVAFSNPGYDGKLDPASPPNFDNMMFAGTKDTVKPLNNKLIAHAGTTIFGWDVLQGDIKATKSGVDGQAKLRAAKIGPIETPSASFYLKVNLTEQAMGIKAKAPLYGELDLKASSGGLTLVAPPSCPLRPFGFRADVTDLAKADFPIEPIFDDCFSKTLNDLVAGGQVAYEESAELVKDVTGAAAKTADDLYKGATGTVDDLALKRAKAWGEELGKLKAVQDAGRYAAKAYTDALDRVAFLAKEIPILGTAIDALTREIDDLLKQVWKYLNPKNIWSAIDGKKNEKSKKISTRDTYLAEEPAAMARRDEAKKIVDKKTEEAAQFPSPYVSASVAGEQEALLGALSQAEVQISIAEAMRNLPAQLVKDANSRKALFDKLGSADKPLDKRLLNARQASEDQFNSYKNLSDLAKAGGDQASGNLLSNAKKTLISEAVDAKVAAEAERLLAETVSRLPTMAYDKDVDIVLDRPGEPDMCWGYIPDEKQAGHYYWHVSACSSTGPSIRGFRFNRSGTLALQGVPCYYVNTGWGTMIGMSQVNCKSGADLWKDYHETLARFFFDPVDGLIRIVSRNATPTCLRHEYDKGLQRLIVVGNACPGPNEQIAGTRFRLVERSMPGAAMKTPVAGSLAPAAASGSAAQMRSVAGRLKLPALDPGSRTNLAPLKLVPRKPK